MGLLLASRQSDLARLQAYQVGQALTAIGQTVIYHFRESLGDINQDDPLWQMPEKGVFTEDFREGLIKGQWDMVVHSWKDLPIDSLPETEIVATLPRADARDVFLCKRSRLKTASAELNVFSSSPRRIYNLTPLFFKTFPQDLKKVNFHNVRGNILTRVKKLIEDPNVDGLVVAKAALDRLLTVQGEEFQEGQGQLAQYLEQCVFQVLPLSSNPTAAAQGALAVEIKKDRQDLRDLLTQLHCQKTWDEALRERQVLKSYGGGCHQKIGVSVSHKDYGVVEFLRGETESGEVLEDIKFSAAPKALQNPYQQKMELFKRQSLAFNKPESTNGHLVSRSNAVPDGTRFEDSEILWAAGLKTWEKLARRGYWVSGCTDSLGEDLEAPLGTLLGERQWARWTHDQAPKSSNRIDVATYKLEPVDFTEDLSQYEEFFWASGSQFERAVALQPVILNKTHYCGPGHTYTKILQVLKAKNINKPPQRLPHRAVWLRAIEEFKK